MAILEYGKHSPWRGRAPALLAGLVVVVGLAGNALAIWSASRLRYAPTGVSIRPMGVSLVIFLAAVAAFVLGVPSALLAICLGWRKPGVCLAALLGAALCLLPLYSGQFVWNRIVAERGLIIGD